MSHRIRLAALSLCVCFAAAAIAADPAPGQTKTGPIKSVDSKAHTFVVTLPARPLTFKVDDKTAITLDDKASTFEKAIVPDNTVTVTYTRTGEDRLATKVEAKSAAAK
jgi:hypothetical protein